MKIQEDKLKILLVAIILFFIVFILCIVSVNLSMKNNDLAAQLSISDAEPKEQVIEEAKNIVKKRVVLMRLLDKHFNSIRLRIWTPQTFDRDLILNDSKAIHENSKKILDLFNDPGLKKNSNANLDIWEKWDNFSEISNELTDLSGQMVDFLSKEKKLDVNQYGRNYLHEEARNKGVPIAKRTVSPMFNHENELLARSSSSMYIRKGFSDNQELIMIFSKLLGTCEQCHISFVKK